MCIRPYEGMLLHIPDRFKATDSSEMLIATRNTSRYRYRCVYWTLNRVCMRLGKENATSGAGSGKGP